MTASAEPDLTLVISTYKWPEALDVVLLALSEQSGPRFEVIVADDGSGGGTTDVLDRQMGFFRDRLKRVWISDAGFRKARVLNLAALEARGPFLVFIDGDCLPRRGFLEAIRRAALAGWFLCGKRLHLSPRLTRRVLEKKPPVWRWSAARWLVGHPRVFLDSPRQTNRAGALLPLRDRRRPWRPGQPEFSPPYDSYGFLFGVSRTDFELVNGFDMRFVGWGGEARDIAIRLRRLGLRCGWPGPQTTMLHLWHTPRKGSGSSNQALVEATLAESRVEAVSGLRELAAEISRDQVKA
jgi:glycosyltransferase involved in cell wall biosynthesis